MIDIGTITLTILVSTQHLLNLTLHTCSLYVPYDSFYLPYNLLYLLGWIGLHIPKTMNVTQDPSSKYW